MVCEAGGGGGGGTRQPQAWIKEIFKGVGYGEICWHEEHHRLYPRSGFHVRGRGYDCRLARLRDPKYN